MFLFSAHPGSLPTEVKQQQQCLQVKQQQCLQVKEQEIALPGRGTVVRTGKWLFVI